VKSDIVYKVTFFDFKACALILRKSRKQKATFLSSMKMRIEFS